MTTFSFSTGNPSNLTGGATASMTDISGSLTDIKTFINGSVTDTNVSAGSLTYASLSSTIDSDYESLMAVFNGSGGGAAGGTYLLGGFTPLANPSTSGASTVVRYLDPAHYPAGSRAGKMRVAATLMVNATAPGINVVFGLYPITAAAGGAGSITFTTSAVVTGSTCTFTTPSASSVNHLESTDFTFPAAGYYALGVVLGGTTAANNVLTWGVSLDFKKV